MTTAERIYQATKELPEPALAELLDFAEFLKQKKIPVTAQPGNRMLLDLRGGLEDSVTFADDPLTIQQKLRDEWH